MPTKVVYILSNVHKALAFEWVATYLDKTKFELSFILLNEEESDLQFFLEQNVVEVRFFRFSSKKDLIKIFFQITFFLLRKRPQIVHTHLFEANLVGLFTGFILRISKRIYTRHSSTFNHENFPKSVKYDRLTNYFATQIVSISAATKETLIKLEGVSPSIIVEIPHGFDLNSFQNPDKIILDKLRNKYVPNEAYPVIGVISRYIEWKGIEYTVTAFKELKKIYPKAHLILANANGSYKAKIHNSLQGLEGSFTEIQFENELFALYHLFDVFVHVPINKNIEAFGQIYVESLAAGIPSVFTLSGIANELCKNEENCLVVDYKNSAQILVAIERILGDENLRTKLIENGKKSIQPYSLEIYIQNLEKLYS